ncbi:ATP-dependent RNA helicase glh-4 [Labeo rohita]|uniref:ATP-dependent RNA helicase glh-4 n=1 Tax=Labeo rohita TaxID=84645 RepID=A0ABQ8L7C0_LABRO|nr:ATP-dependent RNA helicase glh-4 [Labeo rohita]
MDGLTGNNLGLVGEGQMAKNTGLEQERNEANDDGLERETSIVNNAGTERERSGINEAGPKNGQRERNNQFTSKRKYLKEATVIVNVEEINEVRAMDIIKAVTEKYGNGKILALRPRQGKEYELTMENKEVCHDLADGLLVKGVNCEVKKLQNRDYVVSFMHLPAYLDDEIILNKLEGWGVFPLSKIKRRLYPGTNIEDGTRFVKVRFPREIVSLPYSTKLEMAEGPQFFRVMHSNQVKTCKLCMSPDHLVKDCPDFQCYKCEERGHFAQDCDAVRCPECRNFLNKCECWMEEEEGGGDIQVGGQVHEGSNEEEQSATPAQAQQIPRRKTKMITPSFKDLLEAAEKDEQKEQIDSGREEREEQTEKDKIVRRQTRRSSKVTPKLDIPKKVIKKGQIKHRSRYEVLRGLEEEKED